jgi:hypothetical protein
MADKAAAMFSFISSTLRRHGDRNTRSLTYTHKKTLHGMISGDLGARIFLNTSGAAEGQLRIFNLKSEWKGNVGTFRDKHEEIM